MISVKIKNADTILGKPGDWKASDGDCESLFIRKEKKGSVPVMLSAWKPSAYELELLNNGGSVVLGVVGSAHPPVLMYVSVED